MSKPLSLENGYNIHVQHRRPRGRTPWFWREDQRRRKVPMKIAEVRAFRLFPRVIKEAWVADEYVWPSEPPSFLVKVTAEDGVYGLGPITSQTCYLGETAAQIAASLALYDKALRGQDPANNSLAHQVMEAELSGGMPGGRGARSGVDMALYDLTG